ncbi:MAG TPA: PQQ-binding-like beta-propeller repeat protein [Vicinamibacteria bacterium]|nr:PQQ-binding-like beta-propeller repeat protein [Vicinamibacteria bacterium]
MRGRALSAAVLFLAGSWPAAASASEGRYWPQWRGPLGTGEAPDARPPVEWSETKNVRWKVQVPGLGKSTPVVWDDLVILTSAVPTSGPGYEFVVLAYGRGDGKLRWRRAVKKDTPHEGMHKDSTYASGSALTDGKRIYAFFGSRGLYALDMNGRVLWQKELGRMQTRNAFGEGASPALHRDTLVVTWDHEGADFIVALSAADGKEKWRKQRDEPTTWATPLVVEHGGRAQVVVGGTNKLLSYDLETGDLVWQAAGLTMNVIPSPVAANGIVYAMSGFRGAALRAIRLADAKGEVSGPPALAWSYDKYTPYVPSPLLVGGGLYFLKSNSGILTVLDTASGTPRFSERLEGIPNVYASPVAADGRIYVVGREGSAVVLAAGPQLKVLATNRLDDAFDASPALVDGELYLRGAKHLYRISAD